MGKHGIGYVDDDSFVKTNESCLGNGLRWGFKGGVVGAYTYYIVRWIIFVALVFAC